MRALNSPGADLPPDLIGWSGTLNRFIVNHVRNQADQSLPIRGQNPFFPARRANAAMTIVSQQAWQCEWQKRIVIDGGQDSVCPGFKNGIDTQSLNPTQRAVPCPFPNRHHAVNKMARQSE